MEKQSSKVLNIVCTAKNNYYLGSVHTGRDLVSIRVADRPGFVDAVVVEFSDGDEIVIPNHMVTELRYTTAR